MRISIKAKFVAVRSSATAEDSSVAAWAGQLESYLNTTRETLLDKVKKCWSSLFTPRAIVYRFAKGLHDQRISVAVVVQEMVESEVSGIAFSVHPITLDDNQMIIEAGYGLGEAIVSGQITPDSYVVEKRELRIVEKRIGEQEKGLYKSKKGGNEWRNVFRGNKQKLPDGKIKGLAKLVAKIERHYGFPVDVEWALQKGRFYVVQSRPITTLREETTEKQDSFSTARRILKQYHVHPPFIHKGFHAYFYPIDFVQLIWNLWGKYEGYYYRLHISALHNNYWDLYYIPEEFTALRNHYLQNVQRKRSYLQKHYADWKKSCARLSKAVQNVEASFRNHEPFPKVFRKYQIFVKEYLFEYALAAPIQEACGFQPEQWINLPLQEFCQKYGLPYQKTAALLLSPVVHSFITEEELSILNIALAHKKDGNEMKLKKALLAHQQAWFWVQSNYATIRIITPEEFKKRVMKLTKLSEPDLKRKIRIMESISANAKEKKKMLFKKHPPSAKLRLYIKIAELFSEMQDVRKEFVLKANHYHKLFLERVSLEYRQPIEHLWYYSYGELCTALKNRSFIAAGEIQKRKKMIVEVESKKEKIILSGEEAQYFFEHLQEKVGDAEEFSGIIAQTGKARGKVVIVLKSHDLIKVSDGDILVASMTRPEMTVAMQKAAAFVTDEGGITSHAAIISRELKKPCVVGTKIATQILKDGDLIEVDANKGIIRILKRG